MKKLNETLADNLKILIDNLSVQASMPLGHISSLPFLAPFEKKWYGNISLSKDV